MNGKFSRSFQLVKESFQVIKQDKEIMIFPLLGFLATSLIGLLIFHIFDIFNMPETESVPTNFVYAIFVLIFFLDFIFIFCNAGIIITTYARLSGKNPTFTYSLKEIGRNFYRILAWALFAATIGVALAILKEKGKGIGRFFGFVFNIAWNLITFLTFPIILIEKSNIRGTISRSEELFKKTWGENIIGQSLIYAFFANTIIATMSLLPLSMFVGLTAQEIFGVNPNFIVPIVLPVFLILILIQGILYMSIKSIYATAAYYYATTGKIPPQFSPEFVESIKEKNL